MLKTIPLLLETMQCPIIKPQRFVEVGKTQKNLKKMKMQKLVSFCVFVVPKHIAHKRVIKSNFD